MRLGDWAPVRDYRCGYLAIGSSACHSHTHGHTQRDVPAPLKISLSIGKCPQLHCAAGAQPFDPLVRPHTGWRYTSIQRCTPGQKWQHAKITF